MSAVQRVQQSRQVRHWRRAVAAMAAGCVPLLGAGCGESVSPEPVQGTLVPVSGDAQATLPGGQVPRPLVIRALGGDGQPRAGVLVHWSGSAGSEFVSDTTRTDGDGFAAAVWVVGETVGEHQATAAADGMDGATFMASSDPEAVEIVAVPDTVRFHALEDTAGIWIRARSESMQLDTLIDPRGWSSPADPVAVPVVVDGRMLLRSVRNGTSHQHVFFGNVPAPFTAVVKQVAVEVRIVPAGTTLQVPDTLVIGPDSTMALEVMAIDSRGRVVEDAEALAGVTWESSDPGVATVDDGVVRAVGDGFSTVSARYDDELVEATVRVWTMRPAFPAAGGGSTCALLDEGGHAGLACWGYRQVGNNSALDVAVAPEERGVGPLATLSMSDTGACGLTPDGAARCWGRNNVGQLGTGSVGTYQATPVVVSGDMEFESIAAGPSTSCALTPEGTAYCWGAGSGGALGDGGFGELSCGAGWCTPAPTRVLGEQTFTRLAVGGRHACAIDDEGRAYCWGSNRYGQLGSPRVACAGHPDGDPGQDWCSPVPVEVDGGHRFTTLSAGVAHTCGVTADGSLLCWGGNLNGVLGVAGIPEDPSAVNPDPLPVAPERRFASVQASTGHTCAIDADGGAWCWGLGFAGQLGTGAAPDDQCLNGPCALTPVPVTGDRTFARLAPGTSHTCGLTVEDVAYCWGWGGSGALGTGGTEDRFAPARVLFQKP